MLRALGKGCRQTGSRPAGRCRPAAAAMVAPTAIRSSEQNGYSNDRQSASPGPAGLANISQLTRSLSSGGNPESSAATAGHGLLPQADNDDYNSQNEQSRKQAFLETAGAHQT